MATILSNLNRFKKISLEDSLTNVVKWILKITSHFVYVATLPCKTLMLAKQAINNKLQGSVATYLRCAGAVDNQIRKGLLQNQ